MGGSGGLHVIWGKSTAPESVGALQPYIVPCGSAQLPLFHVAGAAIMAPEQKRRAGNLLCLGCPSGCGPKPQSLQPALSLTPYQTICPMALPSLSSRASLAKLVRRDCLVLLV